MASSIQPRINKTWIGLFILLLSITTSCEVSSDKVIYGEIGSYIHLSEEEISTASQVLGSVSPGNYYLLNSSNPNSHRDGIIIIYMGPHRNVIKTGDIGKFNLRPLHSGTSGYYKEGLLKNNKVRFYKLLSYEPRTPSVKSEVIYDLKGGYFE